ncbi:hypothetical protein [Staphylococcus americanisciuri]|uniref:Group-specific protein n=1 Tax=Staphylococcus americanisciuri TaxID=2973940 RepID=A0ABT2F152_9STAP|nr:hypothetical protein [Staphylococcus americanisciuri]MCS4486168.1 hypothetical protein [Staphylococcus americanisciuri]
MDRLLYAIKFGIIFMLAFTTTRYIVPFPDTFLYQIIYGVLVGITSSFLTLFLVGKRPK